MAEVGEINEQYQSWGVTPVVHTSRIWEMIEAELSIVNSSLRFVASGVMVGAIILLVFSGSVAAATSVVVVVFNIVIIARIT